MFLKEWLNGRNDPNAPWNSSSIQGLLSFGSGGRRNLLAAASGTTAASMSASSVSAPDSLALLNSVVTATANYSSTAYYSTRRHERDVHLPPASAVCLLSVCWHILDFVVAPFSRFLPLPFSTDTTT